MSISLQESIGDFFKTKEKWMTLLLLSICQLIPFVGPMVVLGYLFRRFAMKRSGIEEPDFKFDDFGEYLQLGLWPILAYMVLCFLAIPLIFVAQAPMFMTIMQLEGGEPSPAQIIVPMLITYALIAVVALLILVFAGPIVLRSGMMKSFSAGFSRRFIFSFLKKVGFSFLLWMIALSFIATIGSLFGMLALYVGSIAVSTISMYAMFHLLFQHYDLYLERGGEPIDFHPEVLSNNTSTPPLPQTGDQV